MNRYGLTKLGLLAAPLTAWPKFAVAHAAEDGFVLLLPTNIYIPAGVAAFALTAVILTLVSDRATTSLLRSRNLTTIRAPEWMVTASSLISTIFVLALVWIGMSGPNDPLSNLLPLMIWSSFWAGFVVLHMLIADVWRWIDPWAGLYKVAVGTQTEPLLRLPMAMGCWPAICLFVLFTGFSIVDPVPADPGRLAELVGGYWLFTFVGMILFGAPAWSAQCEVFGVFFRLISQVSMIRLMPNMQIGLPGRSAVSTTVAPVCVPVFCLVMLGMGSFDGLSETFWWLDLIGVNPLDFQGRSTIVWQTVGGIVLSNLVLLGVFGATAWLGCRLALRHDPRDHAPVRQVFTVLAFSTLPVFLGFHFAHFLPTFLVWSQYTLAALNDPLANGSNLLGLDGYRVRVGFMADADSVHMIWLVQGGVIVLSHIFAVIIAHTALRRIFSVPKAALWAEIPASVFLLGYTWFGLWLLATARGA